MIIFVRNYNLMKYCVAFLFLILFACKQPEQQFPESPPGMPVSQSLLDSKIEASPFDSELRFLRAMEYYNLGEYEPAVEDLRVAILNDSTKTKYFHLLGDALLEANNSSRALMTMQTAAKLFPDSIKTLLKLSEFQLILEQYDESISTANSILRTDPQNAEAYFMIGLNFRSLGDTIRAINAFQTATEFDAKLTDAWILLGNIFEAKNEPIAARYYDAAVNVDPTNINALHSKAFYLQNNDQILEALALYEKIEVLDPRYEGAFLNAGILFLEIDSLQKADEQFSILISTDPSNKFGHYYKALVSKLTGNISAAKIHVDNALNLDPDFQEAKTLKEEIIR